ncbi:MAG: 1-deoxy-D-xylulose-5-phosphate reductoisomerase, partial [Kordiimonadaceae bacterium]|nr:1-deoxy-D-xylulose-5-phosphate reductoisomerase [Kordiimonadaceae bacterium]
MNSASHKSITVLGATGSVGLSTLDLVRRSPENFSVVALTANSRVQELVALANEFRPAVVVVGRQEKYAELKEALAGTGIECAAGAEALACAAAMPADIVMAAIVGAAGLAPTLAAVRTGTTVALANKECLVCAGDLMMQEVSKHGARLLPVDSEHNAIFQVFDVDHTNTVKRLVLTASGGPFLRRDSATFAAIKPSEAVAHPNWDMGAKISVDSATMMNKGL